MLPRRVKYCRVYHGRIVSKAYRGSQVAYGDFDLQALESAWITSNQIEAIHIAIARYTKRFDKVWIRISLDKPVAKKPAETRMGSNKGAPECWMVVVKPGRVTSGIGGVAEATAGEAVRLAVNKLSVKCKFVKKEETGGEQS